MADDIGKYREMMRKLDGLVGELYESELPGNYKEALKKSYDVANYSLDEIEKITKDIEKKAKTKSLTPEEVEKAKKGLEKANMNFSGGIGNLYVLTEPELNTDLSSLEGKPEYEKITSISSTIEETMGKDYTGRIKAAAKEEQKEATQPQAAA